MSSKGKKNLKILEDYLIAEGWPQDKIDQAMAIAMQETDKGKKLREDPSYHLDSLKSTFKKKLAGISDKDLLDKYVVMNPIKDRAKKGKYYEKDKKKRDAKRTALEDKVYGGYPGRGFFQNTNKDEYESLNKRLKGPQLDEYLMLTDREGQDFIKNPEIVEDPHIGKLAAKDFWDRYLDKLDTFKKRAKRVNPYLGMKEKQEYLDKIIADRAAKEASVEPEIDVFEPELEKDPVLGFNEGGIVKKYADGGKVDSLKQTLKDLADTLGVKDEASKASDMSRMATKSELDDLSKLKDIQKENPFHTYGTSSQELKKRNLDELSELVGGDRRSAERPFSKKLQEEMMPASTKARPEYHSFIENPESKRFQTPEQLKQTQMPTRASVRNIQTKKAAESAEDFMRPLGTVVDEAAESTSKIKRPLGALTKEAAEEVSDFIRPRGFMKKLPGLAGVLAGGVAGLASGDANAAMGDILGADAVGEGSDKIPGRPMHDVEIEKALEGRPELLEKFRRARALESMTPEMRDKIKELEKRPSNQLYAKGGVVHAEDGYNVPELLQRPDEESFIDKVIKSETEPMMYYQGLSKYQDIPEQPLNQKPEPISDEEPKSAREQALINEIAGEGKEVEKTAEGREPTSEPKSKKKPELDVQSKYEQLLAELEKPAKREEYGGPSWGAGLADSLATLSNIYNYAQGDKPMFKPSAMASERARFDKQQATQSASAKDNIKRRAEILKQLQDLKGGGMTAYQKASLDLRKKEHEAKQKSKSDLTWEQKEAKKADIKSSVQEKKENREIRNDAKSALDALEQQEKTINEALKMLEEDGVATGPLDQYYSKFTAKGQTLEKKLNNLALDKMVKMFAGMSKAIDSDAERAFFQSTVPSMGDYERVNIETLRDLRDTIQKLKAKTNKAISSYDKSGTFKEQDSIEHVTMVAPNGQVKTVRKDKVQKYLDKGAKVLEE